MSYDGFGRLKTKHVPEQDPGSVTTWDYNSDDTLLKVTDARDAVVTYGYNSRHLVTSITHSAPAGITPTPNVVYEYDAAGNRTSMTDGLGTLSYGYDQLSRLTSETRTFTDPDNTAINGVAQTLTYDYNPGNGLEYITDPAGGRIDYSYDHAGRPAGVSGSGSLYAGVSNYASGIQYRASGAVKGMAYGNGLSLAFEYNSRLQLSRYEVAGSFGVMGTEFQYTTPNGGVNDNDGRVKFMRELPGVTSKFDRLQTYDQMGRITFAVTGSAARGGADNDDRPFLQTYGYDAFSNLIDRTGLHWSQAADPFFANINPATNRNQNWSYDANGRPTQQETLQTTYDAAGRVRQVVDTMPHGDFPAGLTIHTSHDGDGQPLKHVENGTRKYYVRSTVTGQLISELGETAQFLRGYVYLGGQLLAKQENGTVIWIHRNPVTGSESRSQINGGGAGLRTMLDPLGVDMGVFNWYLAQRPPRDSEIGNQRYTDPLGLDLGCMLDYMPTSCDLVSRLLHSGGVIREDPDDLVDRMERQRGPRRTPIDSFGLGIYGLYLRDGARGNDGQWNLHLFTFDSQQRRSHHPQETAMDIARRKNCATPNSIVEQFKNDFEAQWKRTTQSREENGSLVFYEKATNTYPLVKLSEGRQLRFGRTQYGYSVPAMPEIEPETNKAIGNFKSQRRDAYFLAFFILTPVDS